MAKKTYLTETRLSHDGEDFAVGVSVDMDEKNAAPLVAAGVLISKADAEARAKAQTDAPAAAAEQGDA